MLISEFYENLKFEHDMMINLSYGRIPDHFPMHWHTSAEVLVSFEGDFVLGVGQDTHQVAAGDIAICVPGALHSISCAGDPMDFLIVQFPFELLTFMREFNQIMYLFNRSHVVRSSQSPEACAAMGRSLLHMKETYYENVEFKEVLLYVDLLTLFTHLCNELKKDFHPDAANPAVKRTIELVAEACVFIAQNCTQSLELETVAQHVGFSKFHFAHIFKEYVNMTFLEFLTSQRIRMAVRLLADPRISITEIALRVGYTSFSTFNRTFKIHNGCSPSEFRNKNAPVE
ncbi:MAG: AraC family transcriptional regulator [Lachnospiraceae bacterium]|jgi:AraC-like DNA-binding protein|nr:AraC family transcriptional regulator [Lachnospiraceae bacterium]